MPKVKYVAMMAKNYIVINLVRVRNISQILITKDHVRTGKCQNEFFFTLYICFARGRRPLLLAAC